jgi:nucleotide-binding universal stress UspA family protein
MKRVLVPIDFSDATPRVLDQAKEIAHAFGAEIHLVHVKELSAAMPPNAIGYGVAGMPELMPMSPMPMVDPVPQTVLPNEHDKAKLTEWQKTLTQAGLTVTLHEPTGDVVEEILRTSKTIDADIIVMGRHGHSAMYNLLVGSVTEGVLKRSSQPILLVPSSKS